MVLLKRLIIGFAVLIAAVYLIGLMLPSSFHVQRSVVINAEPEDIYSHLVDLRRWQQWGVWFKRDPNMALTYSGPDRAVGMRSEWLSETEGNGAMEIIELEHNKRVVYDLVFPDMDMSSTGELILEPLDDGTKVTWMDYGDLGDSVTFRYFGLFMDKFIGPDFEDGLANLKIVAENTTS
ncbi:SRPBCC family protein [Alteromonas sp. ASW11-36]|uniref:SRPBCC family protein n=1 Tax=Alteromonas arenosi TaxID=3055817 RepID=A0ABT7SYJ3_9ALTE|nr:SRPBCC family protein [Alteromonas sp. ASW11-36]MDM7861079.1 SRPBCC family protein [Alteromonas sp. ASW11-36]